MQTVDVKAAETGATPVPMTRRDKLLRWADLVRKAEQNFILFHGLEFMARSSLDELDVRGWVNSAFGAANADPVFKATGLGNTVGDVMNYFELSQAELHEFSCDCGGHITNAMMADRITDIAEGKSHPHAKPVMVEVMTIGSRAMRVVGLR